MGAWLRRFAPEIPEKSVRQAGSTCLWALKVRVPTEKIHLSAGITGGFSLVYFN